MARMPNTVVQNELWVRCLFCGDSANEDHAHMAINLNTGFYHCLRCKSGGKVTASILLQLQLKDLPALDFSTSKPMPEVIRGPGSSRPSLLDRYHTSEGGDAFFSWWDDSHVGYYIRHRDGRKQLWGFSGFNWAKAPRQLVSTPEDPLRFVEGPYDVLTMRDVCFFGIPTFKKIESFFREHFFVLVPDGDLWTSQSRFAILKATIDTLIKHNYGLVGVEFLPKVMDPDSAPESRFIPTTFFKEQLWRKTSLSSKAQQVLGSLR